jgi:hypothetical protein
VAKIGNPACGIETGASGENRKKNNGDAALAHHRAAALLPRWASRASRVIGGWALVIK